MRLLHVGPDHVGRGVAQGTLRPERRGREGAHERQHLPMRGVPEHRRRNPASSADGLSTAHAAPKPGAIVMHTFEFIRPKNPAQAIAVAAGAKTAQQGADIRFLASGTTLIDLMKLNVETPAQLIDINRLGLDKIEATPDGGLKIGATVRNSDLAYHEK